MVTTRIRSLFPAQEPDQDEISEAVIRALRRDTSWVDIYEKTGELQIPDSTDDDDKLRDAVEHLRKV